MLHSTPLTLINNPGPLPEALGRLNISASPGTDLWRKPPSLDIHNAPCYVFNIPIASFRRVRVTVSAPWSRQYDQGGLVLFLPAWPERTAWVKAGIENYMGKPCMSVVAARDAADWSLSQGAEKLTLEMEREMGEGRTSLWVYVVAGEMRTPVREVTWVFGGGRGGEGTMSIGVYAARPTKEGSEDEGVLAVTFDDLVIDYD